MFALALAVTASPAEPGHPDFPPTPADVTRIDQTNVLVMMYVDSNDERLL